MRITHTDTARYPLSIWSHQCAWRILLKLIRKTLTRNTYAACRPISCHEAHEYCADDFLSIVPDYTDTALPPVTFLPFSIVRSCL